MASFFQTASEVLQDMLNDFNAITGLGLKIRDLSREEVIKFMSNAGAISMMRADLQRATDNIWPASSDTEGLIAHLAAKQLPPQIQPQISTGVLRITGVNGTAIPATTTQARLLLDGRVYVAISGGHIGDVASGYLDVTFQSLLTGADQNIDTTGNSFSLVTPIVGVDASFTNTSQFTDGRDIETDAEMLARIQEHDQDENTGGNLVAYETWARAADSRVVTATAIKTGDNTVTLVITSGTTDIANAVNNGLSVTRVPSGPLVTAVQNTLLTENPTTDILTTLAPSETPFNVSFAYDLLDETLRSSTDVAITKIIKIYLYEALSGSTIKPTDVERLVDEQLGHLISGRRCANFGGGSPPYTIGNTVLLTPGTITLSTL